jgi:PAS domain S-box-containing protein
MTHAPFTDPPEASTADIEAQIAAASSEDLTRSLRIVLGLSSAFWERDFDRNFSWYSPTFFRILGLPEGLHSREVINSRIHPDDMATFETAYARALTQGGPFHYDVRFLDHAGQYRWARASGRVWLHPDGRPQRMIGMMNDVHVERMAQNAVLASQALYQRALDASSEAHFERSVGKDDFTTSANLSTLLGHPEGTPSPDQNTYWSWVHPDDIAHLSQNVATARKQEGVWEATYRLRQFDGSYRWFRGRGRTVRDADGSLRMTGMLGDVHQQVLDYQELDAHRRNLAASVAERTASLDAALQEAQRQRIQAEEANRAKSEFLAHMSHELRTPLNGVLGMAELARKRAVEPAQRRYLDAALSSGATLLRLIDDVLDFSRSQAQAPELEQAPFDLAQLTTEVIRSLSPSVRTKNLALVFDWVSDGGTTVVGDPTRVRQVLTNLVGNACKYTDSGHVVATGEIVRQGGAAVARITIEDTGCGIDPARAHAMFEPFVQGDASLTRSHGGAGLGLAIARRWARAMGGDVTLAATSPQGSRFEFSWPAALPPYEDEMPSVRPGLAWLLFDPPEKLAWQRSRLERLGWKAEILASVPEAIERAARTAELPHWVVINDPVLQHAEDLPALRRALPRATIVLGVRPHWSDPAIEEAAHQASMPITTPPFTPRELRQWMRTALPPRDDSHRGPRRERPVVLVVEDHPVNRMVAEAMLTELGVQVHCAEDGEQALAACDQLAPDLVLMDLQMPTLDGLEATRRLRERQAQGQLPAFPILALTAHVGEADRREALSCGMDDYITKPVDVDALEAALRRWLPTQAP